MTCNSYEKLDDVEYDNSLQILADRQYIQNVENCGAYFVPEKTFALNEKEKANALRNFLEKRKCKCHECVVVIYFMINMLYSISVNPWKVAKVVKKRQIEPEKEDAKIGQIVPKQKQKPDYKQNGDNQLLPKSHGLDESNLKQKLIRTINRKNN